MVCTLQILHVCFFFNYALPHLQVVTTLGGDATAKEHNYAAKPAVNGDPAAAQKENSSSDSSSEGSSSESSSSSEGESEGEEKKGEKSEEPKPSESTTPLRRGRGRPRKYVDVYATATTSSSPVVSQGRKRTSTGRTPKTPVRMTKNSADTGEKPPSNRKRGRGCGNCPGCLRDDCGTCAYCKDKPKFGGPGKKKQRCSLRICSNFVSMLVGLCPAAAHRLGYEPCVCDSCSMCSLPIAHSSWGPQLQTPLNISSDTCGYGGVHSPEEAHGCKGHAQGHTYFPSFHTKG